MLDSIFRGIFDPDTVHTISVFDFLICIGCSLAIGTLLALAYTIHARYTRSFVATLAMLPAVVCVVIMMVNGNVGTGVAVAGAFGLVRFRSAPGTGREIGALFLAMGAGLITGMGYLAHAFLFALILGCVMILLNCLDFGANRRSRKYKTLRITIPEDLDYTQVFDDLFAQYTRSWELSSVKTTNMGSMFKLTYDIILRTQGVEKELIDGLRCRNGNLEISISAQETVQTGL